MDLNRILHLTGPQEHSNIDMIKNHINKKPCLVFIVAPWCGFCKRLQPTIDTLERELPREPEFDNMSIIKVHDDQLDNVGLNAESFPTIKMFINGRAMPDYSNEFKREADDIRDYIRAHMSKKRSRKRKKCGKRGMKTFRLKKKYKPRNYKGPGSDDEDWLEKSLGIQHGGRRKKKKKKSRKRKRKRRKNN